MQCDTHTTNDLVMTTLEVTLGLVPERCDDVLERLRTDVAPWLRRLPGFRSSRWLLAQGNDRCTIIIDVVDEVAAERLRKAWLPAESATARSWWCERIEPVRDLGLAECPVIGA